MRACHFCGHAVAEDLPLGRSTACPQCQRDLKICLNCQFYAPGAHWDCRETISEPVREKDRGNFCDFFRFKSTPDPVGDASAPARSKETLRRLFGDDA